MIIWVLVARKRISSLHLQSRNRKHAPAERRGYSSRKLKDSTDGARTHGKSDMSVRIGEDQNQKHEIVCWNHQMIHLCWVILALLSIWSIWVAIMWAYFHHYSITLKFLDNVIGAPTLTGMNVQKLWSECIRETSSHLTWAVLFFIFFFSTV